MKSQFAGIILFSIILVFIISFGHINSMVFNDSGSTVGPENLMLTTPTYYVGGAFAVVGNEGTSVEDAWIDISTAMTGLSGVNGYILYVAAGTYNESMVLSSSGAIAQKNEIIAQGTVTLNPTSANYVIEISDKSNIKISGFSISSSDYDGI